MHVFRTAGTIRAPSPLTRAIVTPPMSLSFSLSVSSSLNHHHRKAVSIAGDGTASSPSSHVPPLCLPPSFSISGTSFSSLSFSVTSPLRACVLPTLSHHHVSLHQPPSPLSLSLSLSLPTVAIAPFPLRSKFPLLPRLNRPLTLPLFILPSLMVEPFAVVVFGRPSSASFHPSRSLCLTCLLLLSPSQSRFLSSLSFLIFFLSLPLSSVNLSPFHFCSFAAQRVKGW